MKYPKNIEHFKCFVESETGLIFADYSAMHAWSVRENSTFWTLWWRYGDFVERDNASYEHDIDGMRARFFKNTHLNFAENMLRGDSDATAIVSEDDSAVSWSLSYGQLKDRVAAMQKKLRNLGLRQGDRVVGYLPNTPEAVISMLAVTSLGGVWSCCGWELGANLVDRRFEILKPSFLVISGSDKGEEIESKLVTSKGLSQVHAVLSVGYMGELPQTRRFDHTPIDFNVSSYEMIFPKFRFNDPLYIVFSSGTTGAPKCMVHSIGGVLIQHKKEHVLHCEISAKDRVLFYTTPSWMMWHWLVSVLSSQAAIVLYHGSVLAGSGRHLLDYAKRSNVTVFGASASYYELVTKRSGVYEVPKVHCVLSTGSVLSQKVAEKIEGLFRCPSVYSISGGTDILSCFVLGNALSPVVHGTTPGAGLGMDVCVYNAEGRAVFEEKGELVCRKPFPSMPLYFYEDEDGSRYMASYFQQFPQVWAQGDFALQDAEGRFVIYGRSDTVLNPGGVRIGTAEIYNILKALPYIADALMTMVTRVRERLLLLVVIQDEEGLTPERVQEIRVCLEKEGSPAFVPFFIESVIGVPRTHNGKLAEKAVLKVLKGEKVDTEGLSNPDILGWIQKKLAHLISR